MRETPGDPAPRGVAAFDFDGTITDTHSLLAYLRAAAGFPRAALAAVATSPRMALGAALGGGARDRAKEILVGRALGGMEAAYAVKVGESFAERLLACRIRPEVATRIAAHRAKGHELLIVSASPDVYIEPAARLLGMHGALCTVLEVSPEGILTGRFAGRNCRGQEKAARLLSWVGSGPATIWAYGNSRADNEMLRAADVAVRVGRDPLGALP
jgi:phosphatidylglycerophosphatase C